VGRARNSRIGQERAACWPKAVAADRRYPRCQVDPEVVGQQLGALRQREERVGADQPELLQQHVDLRGAAE
jgi:hypothetical protein